LLDDRFHGLAANGERPNWPPSCFRLFQAIVAGNARGESIPPEVVEALKWLETLPPPVIVVPMSKAARVTLTYVLNNTEGRSRTQKFLRPTLLNGDRLIEFAWQYDPSESMAENHAQVLRDAIRRIRAFGWGIDLAIGHGVIQERLPQPSESRLHFFPREHPNASGIEIRVPRVGSMDSLMECFRQYLGRFESSDSTFLESSVPLYEPWPYTGGIPRPHAIFKLLDDNEDTFSYPHARLIHIAGMVRHVAIERMKKDPPPWIEDPAEWVNRVVRGKRDAASADEHRQFSYVPLPSIGHEHADALIRNVMIVAPLGMERELAYLAQRLSGEALQPEGEFEACEADSRPAIPQRIELRKFTPPKGKFINTHYLATSRVWHTVTPVILDGHDDKKPDKTVKLIQTALGRAGIESPCEFTWQAIPFLKNCLSAHKYDRDGRHTGYHRPAHLKDLTAVHVRISFKHPIPGPIALGAGRHCGFGLMAAEG
jgi:CRISPR-associated protein Csb2